jgi:hypothetical protein
LEPGGGEGNDPDPAYVSGSRMVLFLVEGPKDEKGKATWKPANPISYDKKSMEVSVVWIEKDKVHAFVQVVTSRNSELFCLEINECTLNCRVDELVTMQARFSKAMGSEKPDQITEAVEECLRFEHSWYPGQAAIKALADADKNGLIVLRRLLKDNSVVNFHYYVIEALPGAGGASVGPDLTAMLREDLVFWKKASPGLKKGWWNKAFEYKEWHDTVSPRNRYSRSLAVIEALQRIKFADCRDDVKAFRDFWASQPQLADNGQITKVCDTILSGLRAPK